MPSDEPRLVTLAMAVYGQPKMLDVWFDTLRTYSNAMLDMMELIIVDDCGDPAAEIPDDICLLLPSRLFRVTEDIPWNQPGARNLALEHADTELILFVDPDMVFPMDMMRRMLSRGLDLKSKHVIRYQLKHRTGHAPGYITDLSPNTWFLHVEDFKSIGGYDEDYAGAKGWSDVQLLHVMRAAFKLHHDADLYADFYGVDEIPDAAVTSLDRNVKRNKYMIQGKVRQSNLCGGWLKFVKTLGPNLRFKWEQVS